MREELSTVISNRSAAYIDQRDFAAGLADAEAVIAVRRNWSKGHFRKAKALVGLHRYNEAADAVKLGLAFEPTNAVSKFCTFPIIFGLPVGVLGAPCIFGRH